MWVGETGMGGSDILTLGQGISKGMEHVLVRIGAAGTHTRQALCRVALPPSAARMSSKTAETGKASLKSCSAPRRVRPRAWAQNVLPMEVCTTFFMLLLKSAASPAPLGGTLALLSARPPTQAA
eukprot:scaffold201049_cov33-Tisochrysis_lutea.AAC.2